MDAILLLGHGSRLTEANKALEQVAHLVKEMGDTPIVEIAFLQFGRPDFFEGVSQCASKGARKIIIHPYFLYKGRHFQEDIAEMMEEAEKKYSDIEFVLTEPLGVHENIAKVVLERAKKNIAGLSRREAVGFVPLVLPALRREGAHGSAPHSHGAKRRGNKEFKILKPHEIEERSFEIITEELGETNFRDIELPIIKRVIHATGDFDFAKNMRFHPDAVNAGINAIKKGMEILVDVEMVRAGINKRALEKYGGRVICKIQNTEHRTQNTNFEHLQTKTALGIEVGVREHHNIGIVVIGNAPTALYKTMKLIQNDIFKPELVIGVPVGFVRAIESKEVLLHMKYPFITSLGRKGGSPVAAAIVNALLKMAEGGDTIK